MSPKRVYFAMIGTLLLFGMLFVASIVLGNQQFEKQSNRLLELKIDTRTLDEQQTSLIQAKKDIEKYADLHNIAKTVVPQEKDQAKTVREIINIADAAGVKIGSVTFPSSTLGQTQPKATAPAEGGSPAPATPAPPPITQVKPVDNIKGLYVLEITVQSDASAPVPYSQLIDFLSRLEKNRRTAQVTTITVKPSSISRDMVTFNLVINVYIKP